MSVQELKDQEVRSRREIINYGACDVPDSPHCYHHLCDSCEVGRCEKCTCRRVEWDKSLGLVESLAQWINSVVLLELQPIDLEDALDRHGSLLL